MGQEVKGIHGCIGAVEPAEVGGGDVINKGKLCWKKSSNQDMGVWELMSMSNGVAQQTIKLEGFEASASKTFVHKNKLIRKGS